MKSPVFSVFKLYASNQFSMNNFFGDSKKPGKKVGKTIGMIILILLILASIANSLITSLLGLYKGLKIYEAQDVMPAISLIFSISLIFVFGFLTIASTYYSGSSEDQLLSLPLKSRDILRAKFLVSLIADSFLPLLLLITSVVIYGIKEGLTFHISFYVGLLFSFLSAGVIAIFLIYLTLILLIYLIPSFRNRKVLVGIASVLSFVVVIVMTFMLSSFSSYGNVDPAKAFTAETIDQMNVFLENSGIFTIFLSAIKGNWLSILVLVLIPAAIYFGVIPLISGMFTKSLTGFSDTKTTKMDKTEISKTLQKDVKRRSNIQALYIRDVLTVLREPTFFANGPLMVFLLPIIMLGSAGASLYFSSQKFRDMDFTKFSEALSSIPAETIPKIVFYIAAIGGFIVIFLGAMSSIGTTSFSREGKGLQNLKAMPLDYSTIIDAKIFHAFTYNILAYVVMFVLILAGLIIIPLPISTAQIADIFINMFLFSFTALAFCTFVEMFMDAVAPKLNWENPVAAVKQNLNTMFAVLFTFAFIAIDAALLFAVMPANLSSIKIIAFINLILAAASGALFKKYAVKKLHEM